MQFDDQDARLYIGGLPVDVKEKELDDMFCKFGKILAIDIHRPARTSQSGTAYAFAFVDFDHSRDAEDAAYERNGIDFDGGRLRVEMSRPRRSGGSFSRGAGGNSSLRRGNFKVVVKNIPQGISWQDLKDHMRTCGDVCFSDIISPGVGLIEYSHRDDMEDAVRKLDDSEIRARYGDVGRIHVMFEKDANGNRSPSPRRRSPSPRRRSPSPRRRSPSPRRRLPSPTRPRSRSSSRSPKRQRARAASSSRSPRS